MAVPAGYSKLATIGIAYKGDYNSGTTYKKLNAVYYQGSTYVALIDNPTKPPKNDGANWKYLAEGFDGDAIIPMSQKGEANGVATLDGTGKVPIDQIPDSVGSVKGVKGGAEQEYRTGQVNITKADIGLGDVPNVTTNNQKPTFTQAATRDNIASGETLTTILGKLMKWYADLKNVAFSGNYNDLSGRPAIPTTLPASGGNADTVDGKSASDFVLKSGDTVTGSLTVNGQISIGNNITFASDNEGANFIMTAPNGTSFEMDNAGNCVRIFHFNKSGALHSVKLIDDDGNTNVEKLNGCTIGGTNFNKIPPVGGDGTMEIGKYLDFHGVSRSSNDYSARIFVEADDLDSRLVTYSHFAAKRLVVKNTVEFAFSYGQLSAEGVNGILREVSATNAMTIGQVIQRLPDGLTSIRTNANSTAFNMSLPFNDAADITIFKYEDRASVLWTLLTKNSPSLYAFAVGNYFNNAFDRWYCYKSDGAKTISANSLKSIVPSTDQLWVDENGQFIRKYVDGAWQDIATTNNEEENL